MPFLKFNYNLNMIMYGLYELHLVVLFRHSWHIDFVSKRSVTDSSKLRWDLMTITSVNTCFRQSVVLAYRAPNAVILSCHQSLKWQSAHLLYSIARCNANCIRRRERLCLRRRCTVRSCSLVRSISAAADCIASPSPRIPR